MFQRTTSVNKLLEMSFRGKRKKVVQGSTGAGKTYSIIPILIDICAKVPNLKCTIVCETIPGAKGVADDIFKPIMQYTNRWRESGWIGNPMQYTFGNGSRIQFKAFDKVGKAKAAGKRDILFMNEANHIPYEIADTLMTRSKDIWMDFNADVEFWAHKEVLGEELDGISQSELLILTFEDNEACPEETLQELKIKKAKAYHDVNGDLDSKDNIKSEYWYNWYKVFGRGLIGNISELRIMPLVSRCKEVPKDVVEIPSGLDFGWFPDPTAFCRLYIRKGELMDDLYIQPIVYSTKLSINAKGEGVDNLTEILVQRGVNPKHKTIAESADPRSISDMRKAGFNIEAVKKTDVATSLNLFHDYNIYIVEGHNKPTKEASDAVYSEFDGYRYKKDKATNEILKVPESGQPDHVIDACFVAGTLISTTDGLRSIESIQVGDKVYTSEGIQEVLKRWDNGVKEVNEYRLESNVFTILVSCTEDHLIKSGRAWIPIKSLSQGSKISLHRYLTVGALSNIMVSDIITMGLKNSIRKFGSISTGQSLKDSMFTIRMKTQIITQLIILKYYLRRITLECTVKNGLKRTLNGLRNFKLRGLNLLSIGINQRKGGSGTVNKQSRIKTLLSQKKGNVCNVNANTSQHYQSRNFAGITVNLNTEEIQGLITLLETVKDARKSLQQINTQELDSAHEFVLGKVTIKNSYKAKVYDLAIDNIHEYYANGLLVHNCRYVLLSRGFRWNV